MTMKGRSSHSPTSKIVIASGLTREPCGGECLALEPRADPVVGRVAVGEHLDRHLTAEQLVRGEVDVAHRAAPEPARASGSEAGSSSVSTAIREPVSPRRGTRKRPNPAAIEPKIAAPCATLRVSGRGGPAWIFRARRPIYKAMVSTFAAALLAALGLSGPSATHAAPPSGATFFVSGHGWGHGVGLAQYGAYGYALHGWAAEDIVAPLLPGDRARPGAGEARPRAARARLEEGRRLLARAVHRARRRRQDAQAAGRQAGARPGAEAEARRLDKGAAGAARLLARHGAARARQPRLPRHAARDRRQGGARRERGRPRVRTSGASCRARCPTPGPPRRSSRRRSWPARTR